MQWQEIRAHYPQQWLLLEAVKAHSEGDQRILDQLAVLDAFPDSATALNAYAKIHREVPQREFYVFHTSRDTLDIRERQSLGIRSV
ncbi:MAG TPA: hypothetical protein VES73_08420 [Lamprocystis sp. (in: g-proteobacteria)]|nr:hypothetical protein [Lamprocystis sp. (in: g-proteobacteria)]